MFIRITLLLLLLFPLYMSGCSSSSGGSDSANQSTLSLSVIGQVQLFQIMVRLIAIPCAPLYTPWQVQLA
jgi:hypothetical protein